MQAMAVVALCARGNVAVGEDLLRTDGFLSLAQILRRKVAPLSAFARCCFRAKRGHIETC